MKLVALRRYAIRNRVRICFRLEEAGDCVVNEHGVLKVPSLRGVPRFDVEALLESVEHFTLDQAQDPPRRRKVSRQELEGLVSDAPKSQHAPEE